MSENKEKLVQLIIETRDLRVLEAAADIMRRHKTGESMESIAASYGVDSATT